MGSLLSKQGKLGKRDAGKTSKKRSSFMAPVRLENVSGLLKLGRAMRKREGAAMRGEDGEAAAADATAAATATAATAATPASTLR